MCVFVCVCAGVSVLDENITDVVASKGRTLPGEEAESSDEERGSDLREL